MWYFEALKVPITFMSSDFIYSLYMVATDMYVCMFLSISQYTLP